MKGNAEKHESAAEAYKDVDVVSVRMETSLCPKLFYLSGFIFKNSESSRSSSVKRGTNTDTTYIHT